MDSIPPPEAKLLNVAAAALPPSSASVAMDPAAIIGAAAVSDAVVTSTVAVGQEQMQLPTTDVEMADRSQMGPDNILHDRSASNGSASPENTAGMQDDKRPDALPQLGLTLSPNHVQADDPRPLSRIHSMASTKNGRKSSTPRAGTGRPPKEAVEIWLVRKATQLTGRTVKSSRDAIPQAEAVQTFCFMNRLHACEFDLTYI
ncbi:TPA: hypothetical protein ACH3X1_005204 [Trebouxia sp. C0004]